MKPADELMQEIEALRGRLSRLSSVSLLVNESLDFDAVLQSVLDCACTRRPTPLQRRPEGKV